MRNQNRKNNLRTGAIVASVFLMLGATCASEFGVPVKENAFVGKFGTQKGFIRHSEKRTCTEWQWLPNQFSHWDPERQDFLTVEKRKIKFSALGEKIKRVRSQYVLAFIFSGRCEHSKKMAVEVKQFDEMFRDGAEPFVIAYSVDGTKLEASPNAIDAPEMAEKLRIDKLPTIMAIGIKAKAWGDVSLISYGEESIHKIMRSVAELQIHPATFLSGKSVVMTGKALELRDYTREATSNDRR